MSWKLAPSIKAALDEANRRWPSRSKASDGTIGDAAHAARKSDHNPDSRGIVHAFDLTHDPAKGVDCQALADHLVRRMDSRVKYIIFNRKICDYKDWTWKNYIGSNPHTKHMHVSIHSTTTAENDTTDWWNLVRTPANFAICYVKPGDDRAFLRAANTFAASNHPCQVYEIRTEADFKGTWKEILKKCQSEHLEVVRLTIFSHASKGSDADGLEFQPEGTDDGTLNQSEILALEKLHWASNGELILASCNSGLTGKRGWAPAQVFAQSQQVLTIGMAGYAYFSKNVAKYEVTTPNDQTIYLWAYRRGRNGIFGGGGRMPGVPFPGKT